MLRLAAGFPPDHLCAEQKAGSPSMRTDQRFPQPETLHKRWSMSEDGCSCFFQFSSAMIFSLYDFCEVAGFDDPFQVSQESPTVFAVDLAGQELGFVDVLEKACPPVQNFFMSGWPALTYVGSNLAPALP